MLPEHEGQRVRVEGSEPIYKGQAAMQLAAFMIGAAFIYGALALSLRRLLNWERIGTVLLMLFSLCVAVVLAWRFLRFVWLWASGSLADA
jgi:hypothetical protein